MDLSLNFEKNERKIFIFLSFMLLPVFSISAQKILRMSPDEPVRWIMVDNNGLEMNEIYTFGENPDNLNEGLRRIIRNDKIGFVNKKGIVVIAPQYCQATPFFKGKSIVNVDAVKIDKSTTDAECPTLLWEGGKWGVINKKGNVVKPFDYTQSWNDSFGTYQYEKAGEIFIFTEKGKIKQLR